MVNSLLVSYGLDLIFFFNYSIIIFKNKLKAIHYDSTLLGYMTIMAFYTVLGFSFACYGLCYFIGFDTKDAVKRVYNYNYFFILKKKIILM